jgi:hypothetical protein
MFRLQRRAVAFMRIRDVEGVEVPDIRRSEHRPPTPFSHPAAFPAIAGRMFLSLLDFKTGAERP